MLKEFPSHSSGRAVSEYFPRMLRYGLWLSWPVLRSHQILPQFNIGGFSKRTGKVSKGLQRAQVSLLSQHGVCILSEFWRSFMCWNIAVPSNSVGFTSWHVARVYFKMFVSLLFSKKSVGLSQPSQMWMYPRHMPAYWDILCVAEIRPKEICSYVWFHFRVWSKLRRGGVWRGGPC